MPELSAWVDEPPPALGQMVEAAAHDVQSTYRVSAQFGRASSGGPNASVTSSLTGNFIIPNSCQVEDSSWPAERKKTKSKLAATSSPTSATHAARASVRRSRSQLSPAGHAPSPWNSMAYSWSLPGISYGPNPARSTPNRPPESSIQYSWMGCPRVSVPGL